MRALVVMSTWAWPAPPSAFHARIFPWRMMHAPLVAPYVRGIAAFHLTLPAGRHAPAVELRFYAAHPRAWLQRVPVEFR